MKIEQRSPLKNQKVIRKLTFVGIVNILSISATMELKNIAAF
jgi:hypothetical protein